jgi:hypothetical protein
MYEATGSEPPPPESRRLVSDTATSDPSLRAASDGACLADEQASTAPKAADKIANRVREDIGRTIQDDRRPSALDATSSRRGSQRHEPRRD